MHIGRSTSEWKTECVFFPPPQFFQRLERMNTAATTIQRAFRRKHRAHSGPIAPEEPPSDQQASSPMIVIHKPLSPTSFPIGCRATVTPSHVKHANTNGTVTRHTAKFVEFVPDNCHSNTICILPKSLTITLPPAATSTPPAPCPNKAPNQRITLHASDNNQTRTPGQ